MTDRPAIPALVAGVDTHSQTHTVAVLTATGQVVSTETFTADGAGYRKIVTMLTAAGNITAVGVEGTGSYGAGLTRALTAAGFDVKEVLRPSRRVRRRHGKSDPIDAIAAARTVISGDGVSDPKDTTTPAESIRVLLAARTQLVRTATIAINTITSLLVTAPEAVRAKYRGLTGNKLARALAATRPAAEITDPATATIYSLRQLARTRIDAVTRAAEIEDHMHQILAAHCPRLLAIYGAGTISAAKLAVTAGGNPSRIRNEAAFAHMCGAAPIPASSGKTNRHRLNRSGDRRGNSALHRIAINRLQHDAATRVYAERRARENKSTKDILRCLKRAIAREVFHALTDPTPMPAAVDLRTLRHQKHLTLTDVAQALGTWPARISDIERRRRPLPALRQRYETWLTAA